MNETTEQDDEQPWRPIANRGELTIEILTRARAEQDGIQMHAEATLLAELRPDGLPSSRVGFTSIESLQRFIREMSPRSISVLVGRFEDRAPLTALLTRADGAALH